MHDYLIEMLQCPACAGELNWSIQDEQENRIETAVAHCADCESSYPVKEGIGFFLDSGQDREDLWEEADSWLVQHLHDNPNVESQLMDVPLENLGPADQLFRALVLEERGEFGEAKIAEENATKRMYTSEYRNCWDRQVEFLLNQLEGSRGPIVDLASGRCYLVEHLVNELDAPIVATDFSPRVLFRNRRWLEANGISDRVSLLAFDARHTPFKDGAVATLTTNLGLPNIKEPGRLFAELRRIVSGRFLAITHFFPEGDGNSQIIKEAVLDSVLYKAQVIPGLEQAGFDVEALNICRGIARPTPIGEVLEGAAVDGLPVVETELDWSVLDVR
jgi:uncharacterized protein YbaR (Trm112 family)